MTCKISRRRFIKLAGATASLLSLGLKLPGTALHHPILRFGLTTDSHYADREPGGTRYYRESLEKMRAFIDVVNHEKVDFIVHMGDFKDQDMKPDMERTLTYLKKLELVYTQFNGPKYHVLGNHDMDSISKEQFLEHVQNTGIDSNQSYYSFEKDKFKFIVLDANFREDGSPYDRGNFDWTDTNIPQQEVTWLEKELKNTDKPVIIFVHQLLEIVEGPYGIKNQAGIRKILEKSGKVGTVFQGHIHEERFHIINDINYYTMFGMVDYSGPENNSFAIVDVFANGDMVINGYKRVSNRTMPWKG